MKKIFFISFILMITFFSKAQHWETDFDTAKKRAAVEHRNILLVFSGSDWCAPCMKLEKSIWESKEFIDDSNQHFVLLRADFPKRKANALSKEQQEKNDKLAELYNQKGLFPLVAVLDKDGKVIGTTGYKNVSPSEYIAMLHKMEN